MKLMVSIIFFVIVVESTRAGRLGRTTGGHVTQPENAQFMVALILDCRYTCGGALITKKHVLTAAHCIVNDDLNFYYGIKVMVNPVGTFEYGTCYIIERYDVHDEYDPGQLENDIAVITLTTNAMMDDIQQKISLPWSKPPTDKMALLFAYDEQRNNGIASVHAISVEMYDGSRCKLEYESIFTHFCGITRGWSAEIHSGDSGSPLVYKGEIVGILSFTYNDSVKTAFYTNVHQFMPYIREIIGNAAYE